MAARPLFVDVMKCPRCSKENSYELKFYFEDKRVELVARCCRVCSYLYAEDEALLRAARKHIKIIAENQWQQKK